MTKSYSIGTYLVEHSVANTVQQVSGIVDYILQILQFSIANIATLNIDEPFTYVTIF